MLQSEGFSRMLKPKASTRLEEASLTEKPKTEVAAPYLFNLPLKSMNFTGRGDLLTQIVQTLAQSSLKDVHPVILTACHGLGGVGKTYLAIEYAYCHLHAYTAIYWIMAETTEQIELAFYQLAQALKLEAQSSQAMLSMIKHWWETHPGYLVIFDNVEDYAQIEPYLPRVNGHVLITSRYTQWPQHGIAVDVFGHEEANAYIQKILTVTISPEVGQLAETLGYLPLALAQACAFIKQNHITIAKYLEWYATKRAQLLQSKSLPPGDKHLPVYVNWEMTLKMIREKYHDNKAEKLLTFCAYLKHTGIPKQLLLEYLQDQQLSDELEQMQLLALLINYSLLQEDKTPDYYALHPLMQEIQRMAIEQDTIKSILCHGLESINKFLETFALGKGYKAIPHVSMFLSHFDKIINLELNDKLRIIKANVLRLLSEIYINHGSAKKARSCLKNGLNILKQTKESYSPEVQGKILELKINIIDTYKIQGDYEKCMEQYNTLLQQEKSLFQYFPNKLTLIRFKIAMVLLRDLRFEEAKINLELWRQEKSPFTTDDKSDCFKTASIIHYNQANFEEAERAFEKAIKNRVSLTSNRCNLAKFYLGVGRYSESKNIIFDALNETSQKEPKKKSTTYAVRLTEVGIYYCFESKYEKARKKLERAIAIDINNYSEKHFKLADQYNNLAIVYLLKGEPLIAESKLELSRAINNELEEKNRTTKLRQATYYNNLAGIELFEAAHRPVAVIFSFTYFGECYSMFLASNYEIKNTNEIINMNVIEEAKKNIQTSIGILDKLGFKMPHPIFNARYYNLYLISTLENDEDNKKLALQKLFEIKTKYTEWKEIYESAFKIIPDLSQQINSVSFSILSDNKRK